MRPTWFGYFGYVSSLRVLGNLNGTQKKGYIHNLFEVLTLAKTGNIPDLRNFRLPEPPNELYNALHSEIRRVAEVWL